MKKIFTILLVLSVGLTVTGCMKNYKTVTEYSTAMNKVKSNLGNYIIEGDISRNGQTALIKSYTKTDNKWKTEISNDNGNTYTSGILYDGKEVLSYDTTSKMAISLPFVDMLSSKNTGEGKISENILKIINPVGILFNWSFDEIDGDVDKNWKFGKIEKRNKYTCRMIHSASGNDEVCVNDKYGIAVYAKFYDEKKNQTAIINVKSISNENIGDDVIQLPPGVKKISMQDLFQDMANAFKNIDKRMSKQKF